MESLTRLDKIKVSFLNSAIDSLTRKLESSDGWEYDYEIEDDRKDFIYGSDIDFSVFKNGKDFKDIENYMNNNSINFISIVLEDMDNDGIKFYENKNSVEVGFFCNEQVKSLKQKLEKLRSEFLPFQKQNNDTTNVVFNFIYKKNSGELSTSGGVIFDVIFDGIEKDSVDVLVDRSKTVKVSWDEFFKNDFKKDDIKKTKKRLSDAISRINQKIRDKTSPSCIFIGDKKYNYWLNYDVTKCE